MSEPVRKTHQTPESFNPKVKPEIIKMTESALLPVEIPIETFSYRGITFEIVERQDVLWVGCLDYANNNGEESDSDETLGRFQKHLDVVKQDLINPDWSASIWVNYGYDEKPHGQMFAQETYSANQDKRYELFTQPGGLWLRVRRNGETSLALFGKDSMDAWDYFVCGTLKRAAEENGYIENPDVHVRIGYDCHAEYNTPPHTCYAYMPVIKAADGYSPKKKPEILTMVEAAEKTLRNISEINPFQEALEVFYLPASRVIGIEQQYKLHGAETHAAAPQWKSVFASEIWEMICSLPLVIPNSNLGWTCDYIPETDMFSYIASVLTPANTPVPEGCQFRDIPATLVAVGRWDEPMNKVIEQMKPMGYITHYNDIGCGWNAELYLDKEMQNQLPTPNGQEWRWLIPCTKEFPESYSPKNKPVILEMVGEVSTMNTPALKAAASSIAAEKRNDVRIIELPACKMVTSGPAKGEDIFGPDGILTRFCEWFSEFDKKRADSFYPRDFMWSPSSGGFQWGYAVDEIPADTGGFDVTDFPGGLYAVAISVDTDGKDHDKVYNGILEWVTGSGCFVLDETNERRSLGNITSPLIVKKVMGYEQMDLYFPIAIKEADKND